MHIQDIESTSGHTVTISRAPHPPPPHPPPHPPENKVDI